VREAAEAGDHAVVADGERPAVARSEPRVDREAAALVGDALAVHQRHRQELALRRDSARSQPRAARPGDRAGERSLAKARGVAAIEVARQLVEQQHRGERGQRIARNSRAGARAQRGSSRSKRRRSKASTRESGANHTPGPSVEPEVKQLGRPAPLRAAKRQPALV
jgi:hypothetical protein